MANEEFWQSLLLGQRSRTASSIDGYLSGSDEELQHEGLRGLTDRGRAANALSTSVGAGTRVSFVVNIGSVMSYANPPDPGEEGTVVMVRTAEGDQTSFGGKVFVKFDSGPFMSIDPEHLRRASPNTKQASAFAIRVSNLGDLTGFLRCGEDEEGGQLVHKATQDLWSFQTNDEGGFVISRLFDDTGSPLKV